MLNNQPFADILQVINEQLGDASSLKCSVEKRLRQVGLTADRGLGELYAWLSTCQNRSEATLSEAHVCIFASSYEGGPAPEEISAFITAASRGRAPVNRLCVDHGIGLRVLEMAPEIPHMAGENWSELDCTKAVAFGMEAGAAGGSFLGVSDLAPGNLPGKLALIAYCLSDGSYWLKNIAHELDQTAVAAATKLLNDTKVAPESPLHALRIFGGREVAASLGAFLAAKSRNLPVVIDGWAALASVAVLEKVRKGAAHHVRLAACESSLQEQAARALGKPPMVGALVDGGPGTGTALSLSILKAAIDVLGDT